jgi:hypothetical protein
MAKFFSKFPKLLYNNTITTDILSRISVYQIYQNNINVYYPYSLQEGDTPEIIASKYYNDPERHWIVMVMNNITDPFFEFPLSYQNFILYLDNKYKDQGAAIDRTGSQYAALTVNTDPGGYRAIITTTDNQGNATTRKFFIDESVYNSDQYTESSKQIDDMTYYQTKEQLSIYDYELELNEAKRQIKLLRKEYVSQFESELKKLMSLNYV